MQKFTPNEYMMIDIASNFGLDKLPWRDRISWFKENEARLHSLVPQAKEPALFYAGITAWEEIQAGKATGYMISLDATSSGLQLLAALTGDRSAASLCNVIDTGEREDAYVLIYQEMLEQVGDTAKIERDSTKEAIMTAFYSSKAVPKRVFGEGTLLNVFYETMARMCPGAWELNEAMLNLWNPKAFSHDWVLPDNFHVKVKVISQIKETVHFLNQPFEVFTKVNQPMKEGRSLGANMTHSIDGMIVREMTRRCDYDPKKIQELKSLALGCVTEWGTRNETDDDQMVATLWSHYMRSGYLSSRILDHLCGANFGLVAVDPILELINSLSKKPFKIVSIHDCFRCHPNYGNDMRIQYNRQLMEIARSELLSDIVGQLVGKPVKIGKLDNHLWMDIMQADYALS